jgi:signal transduction histidine kinase
MGRCELAAARRPVIRTMSDPQPTNPSERHGHQVMEMADNAQPMGQPPATSSPPVTVVLVDGRDGLGWRRRADRSDPGRRALSRFAIGTALALVVVTLAAMVLARRAAEREAEFDVRHVTQVLGVTIVENNLDDGLLRDEPQARARMDRVVHRRLLTGTDLRRLKLWTPDGRVVYSDDPRAIGQHFPLSARQATALRTWQAEAQTSDLDEPANVTERSLGPQLLEVYTGVRTPAGQPLLLEAYYSYDVASARRAKLLHSFLSIGLVALVCFLLIQFSVGGVALRWLRQHRARLRAEASEAADRERSRFADGLHDGLLQDLVGASYAVSTAAGRARQDDRSELTGLLDPAAASIRSSVQGLRSMIVDLYPRAVHRAGLAVALHDLVAPARNRGIRVDLDVPPSPQLPAPVEEVLYRCALEACRNVLAHARAQRLWLALHVTPDTVTLSITDDGVGFDPKSTPLAGQGGLGSMTERVRSAGGRLEVTTAPMNGTQLTIRLPLGT